MNGKSINPEETPARSKKNHALIMVWIFVWMATCVAADKAEAYEWYSAGSLPLIAIAINAVIGLTVIVTYMRFLKELDEMQQKIQLNALALAMGIGLVGSVSYSLLVSAGIVAVPDIAVVIVLLGGGYSAGLVIGRARYQ
jgi:hypothetical protein